MSFDTDDEDDCNVEDKDGSMGRFEGVRARRKWRKRGSKPTQYSGEKPTLRSAEKPTHTVQWRKTNTLHSGEKANAHCTVEKSQHSVRWKKMG